VFVFPSDGIRPAGGRGGRWKEDFSDEAAFMKNWASYGWLADGKVVSGPESMRRWWQIHDGAQPVAVRYAWKDWPDYSLANGAGLPASPFRTDDWPVPAVTK
jgi:hypothetical protein